MTETDALQQPLRMPEHFVPYLERFRIYQLFKDIARDIILCMPKDHLKHMKEFLVDQMKGGKDTHRIMLLVSPEVTVDKTKLVREIVKDLGFAVITRPIVMDFYAKHDEYVQGCYIPMLLARVTKSITLMSPVSLTGWIMMDHPCSLREARCLQQQGVLPSVTLLLLPPPTDAPAQPLPPRDTQRPFDEQDFDALRYAYWATLKEVTVKPDDTIQQISMSCFNAIRAAGAGAQGPGQGYHMVGAPGVYRVLLLGPRGSGRRTQARFLTKLFRLVHIHFQDLYEEATLKKDIIAEKLRKNGPDANLILKIINRRILEQDCLNHGWIMTGYPKTGLIFDVLENVKTPPNRVIFMSVNLETCKARLLARRVDWCTGQITATPAAGADAAPAAPAARAAPAAPAAPDPYASIHPQDMPEAVEYELEYYFTEVLSELQAAAGMRAIEVDASLSIEKVQVELQAAIMAAPAFDMEQICCSDNTNVAADKVAQCDENKDK